MDSDPVGRQLLLQVALIAVNAFFASAEMAVVSLNTNKLSKMAEDDDSKAKKLLKLAEEPTEFLSAIQIAITLAGFLGSAFAANSFSQRIVSWVCDDIGFSLLSREAVDKISVIIITVLLSFFTLVFGELVPKRVAMHSPYNVAKFTGPVVIGVKVFLKPVIFLLSVATNGILRLFKIRSENDGESVTEDEIRLMVDIGEEKGTIDSTASEMIENIFDFDNRTAKSIMTRTIDTTFIKADMTDDEIYAIIKESAYSRYPVYDDDINDIIGILYSKDFFIDRMSTAPHNLKDIIRQAFFVPETVACNKLFSDMQASNRHIVIVVDEYGAVSGIVTLEDLVEEVMGNIYDEYDEEEKKEESEEIKQIKDNMWSVSGSADITDISEKIGFELPDNREYDTLAGLVLSNLSVIPEDGVTVNLKIDCLDITVDRIEDRRIVSATIIKNIITPIDNVSL